MLKVSLKDCDCLENLLRLKYCDRIAPKYIHFRKDLPYFQYTLTAFSNFGEYLLALSVFGKTLCICLVVFPLSWFL